MLDVEMLELVRDSARRFVEARINHTRLREGRNQLPWTDAARLPEMAELGWFATLIPTEHGGLGLDLTAASAIAEELGRGLLGEALVPLAVMAPLAVLGGENTKLRAEILSGISGGECPAALAWQEEATSFCSPFEGSTLLKPDDDGRLRLSGEKNFVAGAWAAGVFVVLANGPDGATLIRVRPESEGVTLTHDWRADGSPTGRLTLDRVAIDATDILVSGAPAERAVRQALDSAAIVVSAELAGVMAAALDITLTYLKTRTAFGKPISAFQALQHRAGRLYVQLEIARGVLENALTAARSDAMALVDWSSRTKARANDAGLDITRQAIQLHGAIGFTDECDIGLYLKRALVLSAWLGTTAEHHRRIRPYDAAPPVATGRIAEPGEEPEDWNSIGDETFRTHAAAFFSAHVPEAIRFRPNRLGWAELKDWTLFLSARGWLAPGWPRAFGGMGLGPSKHLIYYEEMERVGAPRLLDHGINNVGSILIALGTDEQRQTYLPKVLSGEHIWCQGYSEPNAGSDLASLRTEARIDGDELVINGQKIWTTLAHEANHMYALVRTDPSRPGRDGISFVLIDLRQPGVTIRPIRNIAGHVEFCEVFFENVRAPLSNVVGALNDGWAVSRAVLGFERLRVGAPRNSQMALGRLIRVARGLRLDGDPLVRDRIIGFTRDVEDLSALYRKAADALAGGNAPGPEASVLKIWATETEQALTEALVRLLGDRGTLSGAQEIDGQTVDVLTPFLATRATTIYGGTNEIQLNIIAKRVLGL
ncbi:acyl-CoA dehydrogenase [Pontitalea aquivivens]|uniref:acyl-CoA dehydrogenase n=1 Tax=Pontitalea aquivivens TaxID=3388663 RepID=UPI003970809C